MLNDKDMLNYNRRKKQAFVNSRATPHKVHKLEIKHD